MEEPSSDTVVSPSYRGTDRRRSGPLNKLERAIIHMVRSKWVAAFVTAFVVSWSFHVVEERADRRLERQQGVTVCVIQGVATQQQLRPRYRVSVAAVLQACEKHEGK